MRRRRSQAPGRRPEGVCPDGLLCALALDPCSIPRNRYFLLYTAPDARAAHRRAAMLRRVRTLVERVMDAGSTSMQVEQDADGLRLQYRDEALALQRSIWLGPLEASLLRCMLARDEGELCVVDEDRARVRQALRSLDARFGIDAEELVRRTGGKRGSDVHLLSHRGA